MAEVIVLRGVPASGKTTRAGVLVSANPRLRRVSRDDIRMQVFGRYHGVDEELVTKIETSQAEAILKAGDDVLIDATNLNRSFVRRFVRLAGKMGATLRYEDLKVPYAEAERRDAERRARGERYVGERTIYGFFKKYKIDLETGALPAPPEKDPRLRRYKPDTSKPDAYGFDLDGTLALHNGRNPYDASKYHEDVVNRPLRSVLWSLADAGFEILILTGRGAEHRDVVATWLEGNRIPHSGLFMRPEGDKRADYLVKSELFDKYIAPNYNFKAQFDDRNQVVDALRAKGVPVYQVAPGDF